MYSEVLKVMDFGVFGPKGGEADKAAVRLKEGKSGSEEEIVVWCAFQSFPKPDREKHAGKGCRNRGH